MLTTRVTIIAWLAPTSSTSRKLLRSPSAPAQKDSEIRVDNTNFMQRKNWKNRIVYTHLNFCTPRKCILCLGQVDTGVGDIWNVSAMGQSDINDGANMRLKLYKSIFMCFRCMRSASDVHF